MTENYYPRHTPEHLEVIREQPFPSHDIPRLTREVEGLRKDLLVLQAQAQALREALKDYYHECQCNHGDIHAVNKRAYTALQMTENL